MGYLISPTRGQCLVGLYHRFNLLHTCPSFKCHSVFLCLGTTGLWDSLCPWWSGSPSARTTSWDVKWEIFTTVLISFLKGLGIAGALGTRTSVLIPQHRTYQILSTAIDADIVTLEKSITHLEESLSSLAEMALQNRKGLDLLFLQQGGLCPAMR